ncbi:MAG: hypothetical protein NTY71_06835 [Methanoregula sp.]|nr:hypothetical protein [Methanoregula sp.]
MTLNEMPQSGGTRCRTVVQQVPVSGGQVSGMQSKRGPNCNWWR